MHTKESGMRLYILCLAALLLTMFSFSSQSIADSDQSAFFPKSFGPRLDGTDGDVQALIDQLSKQLSSDPFRSELYYHLARAYEKQGWHDKAAQYINQWIEISNNDMATKGNHAFMLDEKNDKVLVVDRATKKVVRKIDVGWFPRKIIPTPDGKQLYVTNALSNNVSAINAEQMAVTDTIKTGLMPWNGKSSPNGDRVYVANLRSDDVSVIDIEDNAILETMKVGQGPWGIAISPDGHRLYVSNQNSRDIQVIDTGSYSIVDVISVGVHPRDIALAPDDGKRLYAIDKDIAGNAVEIYVIDLEDARVVNALNVPAINEPLLTRLEGIGLEDKLELMGTFARADLGTEAYVKKPETEVTTAPDSSIQSVHPVADVDTAPTEAKVPMGGPASVTETDPLMHAYVKVPPKPDDKPVSLPEPSDPEPATESGTETTTPPDEQEEKVLRIIVVVKHDTLWQLSVKNYGMANNDIIREIQAANPVIEDADKIYVGQKIKLPEINTYKAYEGRSLVVKPKDNLFRIALDNYGVANKQVYAEILKANPRIKDINLIKIGQRIVLPEISDIPFKSAEEAVAQI